eukprot:3212335-Alexandrium_andersonii.AAC.1
MPGGTALARFSRGCARCGGRCASRCVGLLPAAFARVYASSGLCGLDAYPPGDPWGCCGGLRPRA